MEIKPGQLVALCMAMFGGIVLINMISQQREKGQITEQLKSLDIAKFVPQWQREEFEPPVVDESLIAKFAEEQTQESTEE